MIEDLPGRPRSYVEMRFAASLAPCRGCGSYAVDDVVSGSDSRRPILSWTCPGCGAVRRYRFRFWGEPNPWHARPGAFELGGPEPSQLIPAASFAAEVLRLAGTVEWQPEGLDPQRWNAAYATLARILTCLNELAKFAESPEGEQQRYAELLGRYRADAPRVWALEAVTNPPPPPPRGDLTESTIERHMQWVRRGRTGEGRLDIANVDRYIHRIGAKDLSAARLTSVTIAGVDAAFTTFDDAELTGLKAARAGLRSCSFVGATLTDCDLTGANLALAKFDRAVVTGGTWDRARLDRAIFDGARLTGVSLREVDIGNARLDGATLTGCDLRGADLSLHVADLLGTNRGTRFERCDLRGTTWTGRDRDTATFTDCQP